MLKPSSPPERGLDYSLPKRERVNSPPSEGCRGGSKIIRLRQRISVRKRIIADEPHLKDLARELRRSSTLAEIHLWRQLRRKRMLGYDFDRQKPIDHYIVD